MPVLTELVDISAQELDLITSGPYQSRKETKMNKTMTTANTEDLPAMPTANCPSRNQHKHQLCSPSH